MDLTTQTKFATPTAIIFSGKIGNDPSFSEFLVRLIVVLREKDLHQATKNVIVPNAENIYRPIPLNSTQTITKEAYSKDRSLSAILMNSLTGDAFVFATQKYPITDETKDEDFLGLRLWLGLKAKYDVALIRSEIFKKKQEILNFKSIGSLENFLKEINNKRHFLLAHSKFTDIQTSLLDEDIIQSILTKLPENFNAFIQTARTVEQYVRIRTESKTAGRGLDGVGSPDELGKSIKVII